jgi:hypothetical protein
MLPTTIEDFAAPVWKQIPELNDGVEPHAELLLRPYTFHDRCEVLAEFGICTVCGGSGTTRNEPCRACDGKVQDPDMRPDVRKAVIDRTVRGWRFLRGKDPITGEVREIPFSDAARDGLAAMLGPFYLLMGTAQQLGVLQEAEKKGSPTQPSDGSPTEDGPDGSVV